MFAVEFGEQLFHGFALGVAVSGTRRLDYGKIRFLREIANVFLGQIEHWANQAELRAGKVGNGRETADATFVEEVEHKGFHSVVKMVTERNGLATERTGGVVKRAAAHLSAKGTGIRLMADIEYHTRNFGRNNGVRNVQFFAETANRRKIDRFGKSHIDADCHQFKGDGIKAAQLRKRAKKRQRVFSTRNTNGNAVVWADHFVIFQRAAGVT